MILGGGHCAATILKGVLGECTYLSNRLEVVLAFTEGLVWHVFYGSDYEIKFLFVVKLRVSLTY